MYMKALKQFENIKYTRQNWHTGSNVEDNKIMFNIRDYKYLYWTVLIITTCTVCTSANMFEDVNYQSAIVFYNWFHDLYN